MGMNVMVMNIYVGNLAYGATEEELQDLFSEHGSVQKVNIIKDRETGNSKGFGFVEMENEEEGEAAIKGLDGTPMGGRDLRVNQARPRTENARPKRNNW
jgi:RNA recognition motif-containing protein